ncbi:hypothetical protein [Petrachloros mirabilis]
MTNKLSSTNRMIAFTLTVYWGCLILGLGIPWLATIGVDVLKHDQSFTQALHQLQLHLFAPGYNLFLIAVFNAIPFVLFAVFALFHMGLAPSGNTTLVKRRATGVVVTVIGLIGLSAWTHVTILWFPDAQGAIAYLFLPFVLLILTPLAYVIGRSLGSLIFR